MANDAAGSKRRNHRASEDFCCLDQGCICLRAIDAASRKNNRRLRVCEQCGRFL